MARTKHTGLRSRAGPKSRKWRAKKVAVQAQASRSQASETQEVSSTSAVMPQTKRFKAHPTHNHLDSTKSSRTLPPELHCYILEYTKRLQDRPTLLACGLVCRAWFDYCKLHLFRNIILKSLRHVDLVVQCLSNADSMIHHAKSISMEQRENQLPWGHNVLLRLAGRLPHITEIIFDNSSPFPSGGEDAMAVGKTYTETYCSHPSMHRLLPMLFARFDNLGTLRLDLYRFQSLADLLRLVSSVSRLHTLGCHRLSWKRIPGTSPEVFTRRSRYPQLRNVTITRCPSVWPLLHFFDAPSPYEAETSVAYLMSNIGQSVWFPGLNHTETQIASEIGSFYGLGSSSKNPDLDIRCKRCGTNSNAWIIHIRDIYHIHELQLHLGSVEVGRTTPAFPRHANAGRAHAVQYSIITPARIREIIFVNVSGLHRAGEVVPCEVAALLLKLPYLDSVIFDAAWDSEAQQRALAEFDESLRMKTHVELGAASKAWRNNG